VLRDDPNCIFYIRPPHSGLESSSRKEEEEELFQACETNDVGRAESLLEARVRPFGEDATGAQPIHAAARSGSLSVLKLLLAFKARPDERDRLESLTPLHLAAGYGQVECGSYLLGGCSVIKGSLQGGLQGSPAGGLVSAEDNKGSTPLHHAANFGHVAMIPLLLAAKADPNAANQGGRCPGHVAARKGDMAALKSLVSGKADLRICDLSGRQAAHHAGSAGSSNVLEYLQQERLAKLTVRDESGRTPAHCAAQEGHVSCLEHLMLWGTAINIRDQQGLTPVQRLRKMLRCHLNSEERAEEVIRRLGEPCVPGWKTPAASHHLHGAYSQSCYSQSGGPTAPPPPELPEHAVWEREPYTEAASSSFRVFSYESYRIAKSPKLSHCVCLGGGEGLRTVWKAGLPPPLDHRIVFKSPVESHREAEQWELAGGLIFDELDRLLHGGRLSGGLSREFLALDLLERGNFRNKVEKAILLVAGEDGEGDRVSRDGFCRNFRRMEEAMGGPSWHQRAVEVEVWYGRNEADAMHNLLRLLREREQTLSKELAYEEQQTQHEEEDHEAEEKDRKVELVVGDVVWFQGGAPGLPDGRHRPAKVTMVEEGYLVMETIGPGLKLEITRRRRAVLTEDAHESLSTRELLLGIHAELLSKSKIKAATALNEAKREAVQLEIRLREATEAEADQVAALIEEMDSEPKTLAGAAKQAGRLVGLAEPLAAGIGPSTAVKTGRRLFRLELDSVKPGLHGPLLELHFELGLKGELRVTLTDLKSNRSVADSAEPVVIPPNRLEDSAVITFRESALEQAAPAT